MWRPFASDFVSHTFEDFRKKNDKAWATKPIPQAVQNEKFDPKKLFPYSLSTEELEERQKEFVQLQNKVNEQRKRIKIKDQEYINNKVNKALIQKKEFQTQRKDSKRYMEKIRSMVSNNVSRHRNANSQDYYVGNTFGLTSGDKSLNHSKNDSMASRLEILVPDFK